MDRERGRERCRSRCVQISCRRRAIPTHYARAEDAKAAKRERCADVDEQGDATHRASLAGGVPRGTPAASSRTNSLIASSISTRRLPSLSRSPTCSAWVTTSFLTSRSRTRTRTRRPCRSRSTCSKAENRPKPRLRLARQLNLDHSRTSARHDPDEIRRVNESPRPGHGLHLSLPNRSARSATQQPTLTPPCDPTKSVLASARVGRRLPRPVCLGGLRRTASLRHAISPPVQAIARVLAGPRESGRSREPSP